MTDTLAEAPCLFELWTVTETINRVSHESGLQATAEGIFWEFIPVPSIPAATSSWVIWFEGTLSSHTDCHIPEHER